MFMKLGMKHHDTGGILSLHWEGRANWYPIRDSNGHLSNTKDCTMELVTYYKLLNLCQERCTIHENLSYRSTLNVSETKYKLVGNLSLPQNIRIRILFS
jgi:hypothetical protein